VLSHPTKHVNVTLNLEGKPVSLRNPCFPHSGITLHFPYTQARVMEIRHKRPQCLLRLSLNLRR
jgi:hypothetical protein